MQKFCQSCGATLSDEAVFCPICGTPVSGNTVSNQQSINNEPMPVQPSVQQPVQTYAQPTLQTPVQEPLQQPTQPFQASVQLPAQQPVQESVQQPIQPAQVSFQQPLQQPIQPVIPTAQSKKSKKKFLIPIIAASLALVVFITGILLPSDDAEDAFSGTNSTTNLAATGTKNDISRTIMIYIVGSDLESQSGAASSDIDEMLAADIDETKNNILLFTGGASDWHNNMLSANTCSTLLVTQDDVTEVDSSSKKNMGDSETLTSFLEYSKENYPADEYGLILWNHGGGPALGYGVDELYNDLLTLDELSEALKNSPFNSSEKLEFLGFDACLMGSIETAWIFKDYAEYFIASQETEPGQGWDYTFLSNLNYCANGGEIGTTIIDSYFDYYDALYKEYPRYESELTLSCVDLSKINDVKNGIDTLFSNVNQSVAAGKIEIASRCRYNTKAFGKFATDIPYDLIDLKHLATLLSEDYPTQANTLSDALDSFVVYSRTNTKDAYGVSIYHPYDNLAYAGEWIAAIKKLNLSSEYSSYITNFSKYIEDNSSNSFGFKNFSKTTGTATANGEKSDLSIKLTAEQLKTFSSAQYYVFRELSPDVTFSGEVEYLHVFSGQDVTLASDGTLNATYEGKAVFGKDEKTGKYSDYPLSMYQIYDGTGDEKFYFPCMFYYFGEGFDMSVKPVNWLMKIKNGTPQLLNAYSMESDSDNLFPDKLLIDSEDYSIYFFGNNAYTTQTNDQGNVEFVFTGSSYGFEYSKDDGFSLELKPIEEKEKYYAVFIIEDIYGNSYTSSFFSLDT